MAGAWKIGGWINDIEAGSISRLAHGTAGPCIPTAELFALLPLGRKALRGLGGDGWPLEICRKVLMLLGLAFAMRCEGAGIEIIRGRANTDQ
jgi:hypothetical protein